MLDAVLTGLLLLHTLYFSLTVHLSLTVKLLETLELSLMPHFSLVLHVPQTLHLLPSLQLSLMLSLFLLRLPAPHVFISKLKVNVYLFLVHLPPVLPLLHSLSLLLLLLQSMLSNSLYMFFFLLNLLLQSSPIHDGEIGKIRIGQNKIIRTRRTRLMAVKCNLNSIGVYESNLVLYRSL
jgi:hypothetical protein